MEVWFLEDLARLHREREAIRELSTRADWLVGAAWKFDRALALEAVIRAGGREYPVRMTYPDHFPAVPPAVRPLDPDARWSGHQYGGGTLCLEWGPDTWHPEVTGGQVIESAYRLLCLEASSEHAGHDLVPSRHALSVGQSLRGSVIRSYHGPALGEHLASLPPGSRGTFRFSIHWQAETGLLLVQGTEVEGAPAWEDPTIPEGMRAAAGKGYSRSGLLVRADVSGVSLPGSCPGVDLEQVLRNCGLGDVSLAGLDVGGELSAILVADGLGVPHVYLASAATPGALLRVPSVSSAGGTASRTPVELQALSELRIGVVGLGSAGSKLVLSLARMGASRFYLLDEDVLLPENLCRHALDWLSVGHHKVDALRDALGRVRAGIEVEVARVHLTGQESSAAVAGALERMGRSDVIVDATADAQVFNLLAAVATSGRRPLVWLEIFGGGIGGMIARSRPGKDPGPHRVRAAFHGFTSDNPAPEVAPAGDYAARAPDGATMTASDADVGVIAAHAARFVADTALGAEPSLFPNSLYLLGLRRAWVFSAPFHTIPVDCGGPEEAGPPIDLDESLVEEQYRFLAGLLEEHDDASPAP